MMPDAWRQHALDGEMRLAGVRRAEDGFDAGGETGIQAGHWQMVGCCGAECKRFRAVPMLTGIKAASVTSRPVASSSQFLSRSTGVFTVA